MTRLSSLLLTAARSVGVLGLSLAVVFGTSASARTEQPDLPPTVPQSADSVEGNYLAAVVAGASRDTSAAALYFGEALRGDPRNRELLERAFIAFLASGSFPDAFVAAEKIAAKDPGNGLAQLALGVRALKAKQYVRARSYFEKGGRGRAADITATLLSAWTYAGQGQTAKALQTVDRLKGETAFNLFRDYHAGLVAWLAGDKEEASRRFQATYAQERTTLRVIDIYGRFQSSIGNKDAALAAYEGFEQLAPRQPIIRDAIDQLKAGKTLAPVITDAQQGAAEVLYGLGAAGSQQGDELAAMIYLRLALYLDPQNVMALVTLADILERLRQPEDAMLVYQQVPKDSPMRAAADIQLALDLETLGRGDDAVKHLEGIIRERPADVEALAALGTIYRARKEWTKAAQVYTQAIDHLTTPEPRNWTLYYFRGIAYERSKEWPKAEADFKKALELAPDSQARERAVVLNYLGYSWVDQGVNLDEGFQMLRRAVELRPRDGYIVDSLGWAYYRLGRYDDAVRELERAIELKPSDPTINDHLGDAYWKVGRRLEAKFQWNHARDLNPEPDDLPKILAKIKDGIPDEAAAPAAAEVDKADAEKKNGG